MPVILGIIIVNNFELGKPQQLTVESGVMCQVTITSCATVMDT